MDNLFEQLTQITKAHAYDILNKDYTHLKEENERLRQRVKFLEDLIKESGDKIIENCNKISEIFKPTNNENHV